MFEEPALLTNIQHRTSHRSMTLTVLGTSAAIPAHGRHLSASVVQHGARTFLLDCGEGTQFRLQAAGLSALRLDAVFVTHAHGDHLYGLPGLIATMALLGRRAPLTVVGPAGLGAWFDATPGLEHLPFDLRVDEWAAGTAKAVVWQDDAVIVTARALDHRVPAMGYRVEERARPGKLDVEKARALGITDWPDFRALKAGQAVTNADGETVRSEEVVGPPPRPRAVAYCLDTRPCEGSRLLARDADVLVHDATFAHAFAQRAFETGHATAREAAEVARDAGAHRLLLSHLSARYERAGPLVEEARAVFACSEAACELLPVRL
jgi:ribonuclease Z